MGKIGHTGFHSLYDMKREFSSLSVQEALHVAIFIEERNADIYTQFAELFAEFKDSESLQIAQVFWDMAEEERHHGTMLQERYFERYGTQHCIVTEEDIRDLIEVPKLDNGEIFAIVRSKTAHSPRYKALEIALMAEESAQKFYSRLIPKTEDSALKKIYGELAEFEDGHSRFLRGRIEMARRAAGTEEA
jgi:rubrerythrin